MTVLFCDLVGSTALSAALDPEELADIIIVYRHLMQAEVAKAGGTVARYLGDGLLAYFGYPDAHEDDPVRAVRSALNMLSALPRLNHRFAQSLGEPLAIRIGVHSGLVLIEVGQSEAGLASAGAIGKTPNVAARLQELAPAGGALVSDTTHALTSSMFEYEARGEATLKGIAGDMAVFQPLRERPLARRRAGARAPGYPIGRAHEFLRFRDLWTATESGSAAVLLVTGEPGIGKTHFADRIVRHVEQGAGLVFQFQCQFDATYSPFRALIDGLQQHLPLGAGTAQAKVRRLQRVLRRNGLEENELQALLCELFSLPPPETSARSKLTPEGRRQLLRDLLFDRLRRIAVSRPVLVLMENAHWADPSSLEWLADLMRSIGGQRIMVVVTSRPHFEPAWGSEPSVTRLQLERLNQAEQERFLADLEDGHSLTPELRKLVLDRADGVPLFLEELFKTVKEGGAIGVKRTGEEDIPGSLRGMLEARLDRLGPAKPIAQAAAVIGRQFALAVLLALHPAGARNLKAGLALLEQAGIVEPAHDPTGPSHSFKHVLLRDAAYDSLLNKERREYHAKLTQVYRDHVPHVIEEQPEVVARHASEGGLSAEAVELWIRAGSRAYERSAYREAAAHFRQGLADAERLSGREANLNMARLCTALAAALIGSEGFAAPEVERLSMRAYQLCVITSDQSALAAAIGGLTTYYQVRGPLHRARELGEQLLEQARAQDDEGMLIRAIRRLAWCRFCMGEVAEGRRMLSDVLRRYDVRGGSGSLSAREIDAGVIGYVNLGWAEAFAGDTERALASCAAGRELAVALGERPMDMAYALCMSAATLQVLGDHAGTRTLAESAHELAARNALPYWRAWSTILSGWGLIATAPGEGLRTIVRGLAAYRATGARLFVPYSLGLAADACLAFGRTRTGLGLIDYALRESRTSGAQFSDPDLMVTRARLLRTIGRNDEAEGAFGDAVRLAQRQGSHTAARKAVRMQRFPMTSGGQPQPA